METAMVSHRRSPITSDTGFPHSSAMPKFPWSASRIHRTYCTQSGLLSPYCSRSVSAAAWETTLPLADICAM